MVKKIKRKKATLPPATVAETHPPSPYLEITAARPDVVVPVKKTKIKRKIAETIRAGKEVAVAGASATLDKASKKLKRKKGNLAGSSRAEAEAAPEDRGRSNREMAFGKGKENKDGVKNKPIGATVESDAGSKTEEPAKKLKHKKWKKKQLAAATSTESIAGAQKKAKRGGLSEELPTKNKARSPYVDVDGSAQQSEGFGYQVKEDKNNRKVFVGGIPFATDEDELKADFEECGEIEDYALLKNDDGRFRGMAFFTYKTKEGVQAALQYDGTDYGGRTLKVAMATPRGTAREGQGKNGTEDGRGAKGKGGKQDKGKGKGKGIAKSKDKRKGKDKGKGKGKMKKFGFELGSDD